MSHLRALGYLDGVSCSLMGTSRDAGGMLNQALAAEIRAERSRQRLTQAQVFSEAGIPRATYTRIEAGTRAIDVQQLKLIASALHVLPSMLMERAEAAVQASPTSVHTETDEEAIARLGRAQVERRRLRDRRVSDRRASDRGEAG